MRLSTWFEPKNLQNFDYWKLIIIVFVVGLILGILVILFIRL
ncbi:MAG: hypothetical protein V1893_00860 [Candidatus Omnitrophota bacterium]